MKSNQIFKSNPYQEWNYGVNKVSKTTVAFEKQKPKPPVRQTRQNIAPYSTLQQPQSKTSVQFVPKNHLKMQTNDEWTFQPFEVVVKRNSLGLGLSIMGGPGEHFPFSKLIRIKMVFPLQPAWETGNLNTGDIILSAGGVPLSALTIRQAIDVLRSSHSGPVTRLLVCKPPHDNHPRQVFDELFQVTSNTENKDSEKQIATSEFSDRPKIVHRSFSTCISTSNNKNSMVQCGTPSKGPLSISLFPSNQSTTIFCNASPTKPKRNTAEKFKTKTSIQNSGSKVNLEVSPFEDPKETRTNSPMDYEESSNGPELNLTLDDSVQSFTQCNGMNGPVYVDNSPEREHSNNDTSDNTTNNINSKQICNTFNVPEENNLSCNKSENGESLSTSVENLITKVTPTLGTLDLLKEIPAQVPNNPSNVGLNVQQYGEFSVCIKKIHGSLGFTLCQTDDSTVLRHTIKALVKEPALSDGRIKPGDKLISANSKDCSSLSHTELIAFLRKIGNDCNLSSDSTITEDVELRLYRDASGSQTPVTPSTEIHSKQSDNSFPSHRHSNNKMATMSHPNLPSFLNSSNCNSASASSGKNHKRLRQEAKEMVRSLQASRSSLDGSTNSNGNGNIFHSSRNGSNASASSNSGGHRYKKHLITRPYSPVALVTTHEGHSSADSRNVCSTSAPKKPSQFSTNNESPMTWSNNDKDKSKIPQYSNNRNGDCEVLCSGNASNTYNKSPFPGSNPYKKIMLQEQNGSTLPSEKCDLSQKSMAYNNHYNAKNTIYNIDLPHDRLQRLQIEDSPNEQKKSEIIQDSYNAPILTRMDNSYQTLSSENSMPETQDKFLYFDENNLSSKVNNTLRLGSDQCQRPRELDVLSNENRKTHGYIFHTFGYKSDSTH